MNNFIWLAEQEWGLGSAREEMKLHERNNRSGHQIPTINQPHDTANKTDLKHKLEHNSQAFQSPPCLWNYSNFQRNKQLFLLGNEFLWIK